MLNQAHRPCRPIAYSPCFEMIGYQADMGQNYWGCLYDESRRKKVLTGPTPEVIQKTVKQEDWNDYRIR